LIIKEDKQENYRQQIREYMHILQDIYPGIKIKGFLIYLDDVSVEEVEGEGKLVSE